MSEYFTFFSRHFLISSRSIFQKVLDRFMKYSRRVVSAAVAVLVLGANMMAVEAVVPLTRCFQAL